mmetsp:Transcript_3169/g.9577  ORF Transcript_3169/g.9577 Transcript_3169/m.9577 type:complete len:203 (-) Transcript_3169:2161-2769(-)
MVQTGIPSGLPQACVRQRGGAQPPTAHCGSGQPQDLRCTKSDHARDHILHGDVPEAGPDGLAHPKGPVEHTEAAQALLLRQEAGRPTLPCWIRKGVPAEERLQRWKAQQQQCHLPLQLGEGLALQRCGKAQGPGPRRPRRPQRPGLRPGRHVQENDPPQGPPLEQAWKDEAKPDALWYGQEEVLQLWKHPRGLHHHHGKAGV